MTGTRLSHPRGGRPGRLELDQLDLGLVLERLDGVLDQGPLLGLLEPRFDLGPGLLEGAGLLLALDDLDDVIPERRFDEAAQPADGDGEGGVFEGLDHLPAGEVLVEAAVVLGAGVLGILLDQLDEILTGLGPGQDALGLGADLGLLGFGLALGHEEDVADRRGLVGLRRLVVGLADVGFGHLGPAFDDALEVGVDEERFPDARLDVVDRDVGLLDLLEEGLLSAGLAVLGLEGLVEIALRDDRLGRLRGGQEQLALGQGVGALLEDLLQLPGVDLLEPVGPRAQVVPDGLDDLGGRDGEALGLDHDGRLVGTEGGDDRGQVLGQREGGGAFLEGEFFGFRGAGRGDQGPGQDDRECLFHLILLGFSGKTP
ncbi:MAG: hypothetical protein MZV64_63970 [Ignavibacteriales bacterium]|nr:hypothetical protein [Ignavibacteriales bacterium]